MGGCWEQGRGRGRGRGRDEEPIGPPASNPHHTTPMISTQAHTHRVEELGEGAARAGVPARVPAAAHEAGAEAASAAAAGGRGDVGGGDEAGGGLGDLGLAGAEEGGGGREGDSPLEAADAEGLRSCVEGGRIVVVWV